MTEPLSREEIKTVFTESIAPLVTEFRAAHDAHEKDIDRLNKQSAEHYQNYKELEDKISKQVEKCSISNIASHEKSGVRVGTTEKELARIDQKVEELEKDFDGLKTGIEKQFSEMKDNKQFNISQIVVIAVAVVTCGLVILQIYRG